MIASLPLLPVEGAQGEGLRILVVAIAFLLLILCPASIFQIRRGAGRAGLMLVSAAIALTLGAAFFVHDAVSLPEVTGTLAVGSGLGYMLVRHAPMVTIGRLVTAVMGLAGLGSLFMGVALWLDPRGLGIVAMPDAPLTGFAMIIFVAIAGLSVLQAGFAAYLLLRQAPPDTAGITGLAGLGGGVCFLTGGLLGNLPMILIGAFVCAGAMALRAGSKSSEARL